ncbi:MAG: class I SAM-dependent methyltransferase [Alphaproteobacteria bacterium]|nr:class I SAM-dependent methyltransferase [Alphaproteobacteria bacterium]
MGVSYYTIELMEKYGLLGEGRALLDFGSSNLYGSTAEQLSGFVKRHVDPAPADLEDVVGRLAAGSGTGPDGQALNQAFLGELLELAGMTYDSIDIAAGYKTRQVDLNIRPLPQDMIGRYDTVINCGTSEHILNQINTFNAIHSAAKPGGLMMHVLPSVGFVDHGYFTYTSRFFFDMAGYNQYEVVDMWYEGVGEGAENIFTGARQYQIYFPVLTDRIGRIGTDERETRQDAIQVPTIAICLVFRKTQDTPFMGTLETSTSVGAFTGDLRDGYSAQRDEEANGEVSAPTESQG